MADLHIRTEDQSQLQIPLIEEPEQNSEDEQLEDTQLEETLQRLESLLCFFGFHQSSLKSVVFSWVRFIIVGFSVPIAVLVLSSCSDCDKYQINNFELDILVSQACLAAVSLVCVSHNLRKYGIRRFLFVDRDRGHKVKFRKEYIKKIEGFSRVLIFWMIPCFLLKTVREVIHIMYLQHESWWSSLTIFLATVCSWTYLTIVSLSASALFNLVCNLQVIHFDDYGKLLESDSDVSVFMAEHIRLRHYLSKISHRFRIFLLLEFFVVTASQFVTLFQTTGYSGMITFINGGDFAVSSIVQVVGIWLCLQSAAKISHRAQGIASVASKWHALVTSNSTDGSRLRLSNSVENFQAANLERSIIKNYSDSDLESMDSAILPTSMRLGAHNSSYNKRQAFVMYLQMNPGGVTIFGWTVDRTLINTIFFIELSLVLFVLSQTLIFSSK